MLTGVAGGKGEGNEISDGEQRWLRRGRCFWLDAGKWPGRVLASVVIIPANELHAFLGNHQANPHGWLGMHPLTHQGVDGVVVRAFVRAARRQERTDDGLVSSNSMNWLTLETSACLCLAANSSSTSAACIIDIRCSLEPPSRREVRLMR